MTNTNRDKVADGEHGIFIPGRLGLFGEHSDWAGAMRKYVQVLFALRSRDVFQLGRLFESSGTIVI